MSPSRIAPWGALIQLALAGAAGAADISFFAPATPERPVIETLHGVTLTDRYRWLEDGKNAEVQSWTRAQHAATLNYLDRAAPPIAGMKDELTRYFDRNRTDAPFFKYGREFFKRVAKGEPQAKLYTRLDGREVLLFDPVALDPSGKTRLGSIIANRDGSKLAVGIYSGGSEIQDVRITNSRTGAAIGPLLKGVGGFHWARDERYVYFTPRTAESDAKQEPHRCIRHRLGSDRKDDEVLIQMKDAKNFCRVYEPEEAEVTVFETGDFWSNTIRIRPIGSRAEPKTIYSSDKFKAEPSFRPDRIYFRTNQDAPNWKVMAASYARPEAASWTTLIPEQPTVLDDVTVTNDWIVVQDREDVLSRPLRLRQGRQADPGLDTAGVRQRDRIDVRLCHRHDLRDSGVARGSVQGVLAGQQGAGLDSGVAGRPAARPVADRGREACMSPPRTARKSRYSSRAARTRSWTAPTRRC